MSDHVVIQWDQPKVSGVTLEARWYGHVVDPVKTIQYALVAQSIQGQWYACVWPKGRLSDGPEFYAKYASLWKAKAQLERWTRCHWRTIPLWKHPQDRRAY